MTDSLWYPLEDGFLNGVAGSNRDLRIPFLSKPAPVTLHQWLQDHPDSSVLLPPAPPAKTAENQPGWLHWTGASWEPQPSVTDPLQLKPLLGAWILQPEVAGADKGATIRFLVSDQELLGFWSDGNHQTPLSALTFSGEWLSFEITRESKTDRFEGRIQNDTLQGHFFGPTYWSAWSGRKQQGPAEPQR